MSVVSLLNVRVLNNPAPFTAQYEFEITFECLEPLRHDLDWKLIYVGSATSSKHDQELDSLLVGPIPVGVNRFVFVADAPDFRRIPSSEIFGVTVIILSCSYDGREFVRVGYYVNNEYDSDELNAEPPVQPIIERVRRNVLAEKPRVTRFPIKWDSEASGETFPPEQPEADLLEADGDNYGVEEEDDDEGEDDEDEAGGNEQAGGPSDVAMGGNEDAEMAGAEETSGAPSLPKKVSTGDDAAPTATYDDDEGSSTDGSEDIEGESVASDDFDLIEEDEGAAAGDADGDEEMEMDDAGPAVLGAATAPTTAAGHDQEMVQAQAQDENSTVKVH